MMHNPAYPFHRPRRPRRAAAVVAVTALLGSAACSSESVAERVAEEAAERAGAGEVDIDLDGDGGVSVESSEGSFRAGSGGELPASFPESMPTPPDGYEVMTSFEQSGQDGFELQVALMTSGDVDDLVDYYEEAFTAAGYEFELHQRLTQNGVDAATVSGRGDEHAALLQIVADEDGTMVNYGIGPADAVG